MMSQINLKINFDHFKGEELRSVASNNDNEALIDLWLVFLYGKFTSSVMHVLPSVMQVGLSPIDYLS